jgi:hypothetical protein
MDNQQESFEKGYIAGMIDGEGTIHLSIAHCKGQHGFKPATILKPRVNIVANTNTKIIETCVDILTKHHIPHWVRETQKTKSGKRFFIIMIEGLKRVPKFFDWFGDTPCAKRPQMDTLKEFIQLRKRTVDKKNGRNGYPEYTEKEWSLWQRCKDLNQSVPQRLHVIHPVEG